MNNPTRDLAKQEKVGAEVLFVGPGRGADETRQRLRDICGPYFALCKSSALFDDYQI